MKKLLSPLLQSQAIFIPFFFCVLFFIWAPLGGCKKTESTITDTTSSSADTFHVVEKISGLCYGGFVYSGQSPLTGTYISPEQHRQLLSQLKLYSNSVLLYGTSPALGNFAVPGIAKSLGLSVSCAAWLDGSPNDISELHNLYVLSRAGLVDVAIIGVECIRRLNYTPAQLISLLQQARDSLPPSVKLTTCDVYETFLANPSLCSYIDVVYANIYAYHHSVSVDCGVSFLKMALNKLSSISSGRPIVCSELGWADKGQQNGDAICSGSNAAKYFLEACSFLKLHGYSFFYHEFVNQPWKVSQEGEVGANWGIATIVPSSGKVLLKQDFDKFFLGMSSSSLCADSLLFIASPSIEFTSVPPLNSNLDLAGLCKGVFPSSAYKVAVLIYVPTSPSSGLWWSKPYASYQFSSLNSHGVFVTDITTGGNDSQAKKIAAFLLAANASFQPVLGQPSIPPEIYQAALDSVMVSR